MKLIIKKFKDLSNLELYEIIKARVNVFVVEQKCPYEELDDKDLDAYHLMLYDNFRLVAYLRILDRNVVFDEVSIGRVLTLVRGKGYGKYIFKKGIEYAKEKYNADKIKIMAQSYAKGFYEKFGFKQVSSEFLDDGIAHILMILEL